MSGSCKSSDGIKECAEVARVDALLGNWSRTRLKLGVCYKLLAADSGSNFKLRSTSNGRGEFLKWDERNKRLASLFL